MYGERIRELRIAKGLTQQEVADQLGKSLSAYKLYETGVNEPGIQTLHKLSSLLGASVDYLIENYAVPVKNSFGERIKACRIGKGYTQSGLGKLIGAQQNTLAAWEQGRTQPNFQMLLKLSEALGVTIDFIVGRQLSLERIPEKELALNAITQVFDALEVRLYQALKDARKKAIQEIIPKTDEEGDTP